MLNFQVLVSLNFLGHGSYQSVTGSNLFIDISQPSVSRCLTEVVRALNNPAIVDYLIIFPRNMQEMRVAKNR